MRQGSFRHPQPLSPYKEALVASLSIFTNRVGGVPYAKKSALKKRRVALKDTRTTRYPLYNGAPTGFVKGGE